MSVIVELEGEVWCITKGADNVMEKLLEESLSRHCKEHIQRFSQQGLRTLLVAAKKVERDYLENWEASLKGAQHILNSSKNEHVERLYWQMETRLRLAGITAVEDRLQDGVPEAIETLKKAGVRVWVLTGDKRETAVDIARSCNLFSERTSLAHAVDAQNPDQTLEKLQHAAEELEGVEEGGLVIDGKTLSFGLAMPECRELIFKLGLASRSCVCCRLSPMQKRQLVDLVRELSPSTITLAVGDGANDVPMIEGAHLGVGVRGREGGSAVQVSDVAISQFRYLVPLLLCHGRRAYRVVAVFLCFYLYKNIAIAMGDVIWMYQNNFKTGIAYPEYLSINYNLLFTSCNVLYVLGYDVDIADAVAVNHPELYLVGPERKLFNMSVFTKWFLYAILHGSLSWILPNVLIGDNSSYDYDHPTVFWEASATSLGVVVMVVNLKLLLAVYRPFKMTSIVPTVLAMLSFFIVVVMIGEIELAAQYQPNMEGLPDRMRRNGWCLFCLFVLPFMIVSLDALESLVTSALFPSPIRKVRRGMLSGKDGEVTTKEAPVASEMAAGEESRS